MVISLPIRWPLKWLRQCPYVVCCDGAANTYIRSGMPEAIVGDGDSLLPDVKELDMLR